MIFPYSSSNSLRGRFPWSQAILPLICTRNQNGPAEDQQSDESKCSDKKDNRTISKETTTSQPQCRDIPCRVLIAQDAVVLHSMESQRQGKNGGKKKPHQRTHKSTSSSTPRTKQNHKNVKIDQVCFIIPGVVLHTLPQQGGVEVLTTGSLDLYVCGHKQTSNTAQYMAHNTSR